MRSRCRTALLGIVMLLVASVGAAQPPEGDGLVEGQLLFLVDVLDPAGFELVFEGLPRTDRGDPTLAEGAFAFVRLVEGDPLLDVDHFRIDPASQDVLQYVFPLAGADRGPGGGRSAGATCGRSVAVLEVLDPRLQGVTLAEQAAAAAEALEEPFAGLAAFDPGGQSATLTGSSHGPYAAAAAEAATWLGSVPPGDAGAGVLVAVLDTGFSPYPIDAALPFATGFDLIDDDPNPEDVYWSDADPSLNVGHGTPIAAIVHAVAPAARVLPLRVCDDDLCLLSDVILAACYAVRVRDDLGARGLVLNMSFGGRSDGAIDKEAGPGILRTFFRGLGRDHGAVVTTVHGNVTEEQPDHEPRFPAAYAGEMAHVVAVGGVVTHDGEEAPERFHWSDPEAWAELPEARPGEATTLAAPAVVRFADEVLAGADTAGYRGTSFAAPFVAGALARLIALDPRAPLEAYGACLAGTALPLRLDPGVVGAGLLQIAAAEACLVAP